MGPTAVKSLLTGGTLLTLAATIIGSAAQMPALSPMVVLALGSLAGFFAGWAHMSKPGDTKAGS